MYSTGALLRNLFPSTLLDAIQLAITKRAECLETFKRHLSFHTCDGKQETDEMTQALRGIGKVLLIMTYCTHEKTEYTQKETAELALAAFKSCSFIQLGVLDAKCVMNRIGDSMIRVSSVFCMMLNILSKE